MPQDASLPTKPSLRSIFIAGAIALAVGLGVAVACVAGFALAAYWQFIPIDRQTGKQVSWWAVVVMLTSALAVFCYRLDSRERSVLFGRWRVHPGWYPVAVLAGVLVWGVPAVWGEGRSDLVDHFFEDKGDTIATFFLGLIIFAVLLPILDELIFRRAFYAVLGRINVWLAFVVTVAVYGLLHPGSYAAVPLAAITAYLLQRTGSLLPSIVAHGVYGALRFMLILEAAPLPP